MRNTTILKISADIAMTVMLLLLMSYELIGDAIHEWLGIGIFVLFVIHHILNRRWSRNIGKGKYTPVRILQTVLVIGAFLSMIGSMFSGIILSEYALAFLPVNGGHATARVLHMICGYWGFVIISLHLGVHWCMITGMAKRWIKHPAAWRKWLCRGVAALIAAYGVYAFFHREIGSYMILKNHFVFFDFEEPLLFFFVDYIAVMGLFVWIGHYGSELLKRIAKRKKNNVTVQGGVS